MSSLTHTLEGYNKLDDISELLLSEAFFTASDSSDFLYYVQNNMMWTNKNFAEIEQWLENAVAIPEPTTIAPTTMVSTTAYPTTANPSTANPTTANPTANPTTSYPTTLETTTLGAGSLIASFSVVIYCAAVKLMM